MLDALGVRPGDRVAVQVEKSPEALMLYLACLRTGAVYLPLNTAYTLAELDYFIGDAEPRLIVCAPGAKEGIAKHAADCGAEVETLDEKGGGSLIYLARGKAPDFPDADRGPDDLAAILYTSGTTGRSKGAMLTHDNLLSNATTLREYWRFTADDRLIHALPIFHTHGLFVASNVILSGRRLDVFPAKIRRERSPASDAAINLNDGRSDLLCAPSCRIRANARGNRRDAAFRVWLGSAACRRLTGLSRTMTGHAILERYGMTETNMNTSNPYDGERIAGTVGFPLPGVSLRVADPESGRPLPKGETGMIEVKGPNVFKGYWRMPEKTQGEFRADGFFITGDLGRIDERGYVHIVGRGKDPRDLRRLQHLSEGG